MAVIVEKPLLEFENGIVKGRKALLLVRRLNATVVLTIVATRNDL